MTRETMTTLSPLALASQGPTWGHPHANPSTHPCGFVPVEMQMTDMEVTNLKAQGRFYLHLFFGTHSQFWF